jgi:hypothetical protein
VPKCPQALAVTAAVTMAVTAAVTAAAGAANKCNDVIGKGNFSKRVYYQREGCTLAHASFCLAIKHTQKKRGRTFFLA